MFFTFYEHKPNSLEEKTKNLTIYLRFLYFWDCAVLLTPICI